MFKIPKYKRKRLISDLMSGHSSNLPKSERFTLKSNSDDFASRLNSVFDGLNTLEKKHEAWEETEKSTNESFIKDDPGINDYDDPPFGTSDRRVPTSFKRPFGSPPRKKRAFNNQMPDYQVHPEKWTKYTLQDVPDSDMSERANSAAAFDFLNSRKQQVDLTTRNDDDMAIAATTGRHLFKKRTVKSELDSSTDEGAINPGFGSKCKFTMPECVVGAAPAPVKKKVVKAKREKSFKQRSDSIQLDHLNEDEGSDFDYSSPSELSSDDEGLKVKPEIKSKGPKCLRSRAAEEEEDNDPDVDDTKIEKSEALSVEETSAATSECEGSEMEAETVNCERTESEELHDDL